MSKKIAAYAIAASIMTVSGGVAVAQGAATTTAPVSSDMRDDDDGDEGRWGLLGLLGLAGLLGLKRRDTRHDTTNHR